MMILSQKRESSIDKNVHTRNTFNNFFPPISSSLLHLFPSVIVDLSYRISLSVLPVESREWVLHNSFEPSFSLRE